MSTSVDPVAALRPTDESLADLWPEAQRIAVRDRLHAVQNRPAGHGPAATRHRRHWLAAGVATAVAAAAVVATAALPAGSPGAQRHTPRRVAAAPLERLAALAVTAPVPTVDAGQYWHVVVRETQDGHTTLRESWTDPTGRTWVQERSRASTVFYEFPPGEGSFDDFTPASLHALPTDPDALSAYLRARVSGSSSTDEAVYVKLAAIVESGFASSKLRAAAIRVLERAGHVTVTNGRDSLGRRAMVAAFVDTADRPGEVQALLFDPSDTTLLEARDDLDTVAGPCPPSAKDPQPTGSCPAQHLHFTGTYTHRGVVGHVPHTVLQQAVLQHG